MLLNETTISYSAFILTLRSNRTVLIFPFSHFFLRCSSHAKMLEDVRGKARLAIGGRSNAPPMHLLPHPLPALITDAPAAPLCPRPDVLCPLRHYSATLVIALFVPSDNSLGRPFVPSTFLPTALLAYHFPPTQRPCRFASR